MRRARVLLPVALGAALVLGGCGGESSPKPAPYTRSASASPTPPATPAALEGTDAAAAKALVEYYLDLIAYASVTGDTTPLQPLAKPSCKACSRLATIIENSYAGGGKVTGSGFQVTQFRQVTADDIGFKVVADVISNAETVTKTRTSAPSTRPAGKARYTFFITRTASGLLVDAWGFET